MAKPDNENGGKKQLLLRLSPTLWADISDWAEDDFRSINSQIEYLLTECVRARKKGKIKREPLGLDIGESGARDDKTEENK